MINVKQYKYQVLANLNNGEQLILSNSVTGLSWGDKFGELAAQATIRFSNKLSDGKNLVSVLSLCTNIQIVVNNKVCFDGIIWEISSSRQKNEEINVIAYDNLIYANKSKDNFYWTEGKSTKALVTDLCSKWGISLQFDWNGISHKKTVINNRSISDIIVGLITEAEKQAGKTSVCYFENKTLYVKNQGYNSYVPQFKIGKNLISTSYSYSLDGLVTKVIIMGKANKEGISSVEKTLTGKTEYGTLQDIVQRNGDTTLSDATKEAEEVLKENGEPKENLDIEVPDIPELRKGWKIIVESTDFTGEFIVLSVTHQATTRTMSLNLKRLKTSTDTNQNTGDVFNKGDSIILNGAVYRDSYGEGKGMTFKDYKSTITIVADLIRKCPYHVGSVGWVTPDSIKKA